MEGFQLNNKYGFKDDDNNIIVPAIYDAIPYSIGDRNIVRKDDKCGVVSQEGDIIIDFIFDGIEELTNVRNLTFYKNIKKPFKESPDRTNNPNSLCNNYRN